jgi:hypothetical protein
MATLAARAARWRNIDETDTPTSDRHGTETVHHWQHEHKG